MARGIVFGGEGDLLTASLVAALAAGNPQTSFSEMYFQWSEAANPEYAPRRFTAGDFLLDDLLPIA